MELAEAVEWWEDWQLRFLVLCSLLLQYILFIAAPFRKYCTHPLLRFIIWVAYLGSDAVAILYNYQKKRKWVSMANKNAGLEALWAPILLMHLGGQDGITAYSLEDNELWKRHVLTAISQITVAIYVFSKSMSEDARLVLATILIFIPGILKCLEKPWALNRASIYNMASTSGSEDDKPFSRSSKKKTSKKNYVLKDYVKRAVQYCRDGDTNDDKGYPYIVKPSRLFVDLSYSYQVRLMNLKYVLWSRQDVRGFLFRGLSSAFDHLYTKRYAYEATTGHVVRTMDVLLTFTAIGLFHTSRREAFEATDVKITYALLYCTAALECLSAWFKPLFTSFLRRNAGPDQVAQYNLIWYLSRNKVRRPCCSFLNLPRWLDSLYVGCKERLERAICMEPCKDHGLIELVYCHIVEDGWKSTIIGPGSYREFNENRGQMTLKKYLPKKRNRKQTLGSDEVEQSIRSPFDESVLLWHLATDFCFHMTETSPMSSHEATTPDEATTANHCKVMSNYMAYLLFVKPEMLIPGARHDLFKAAYRELKYFILKLEDLQQGEGPGDLAKRIVYKMKGMRPEKKGTQPGEKEKGTQPGKKRTHFTMAAWRLAQELKELAKMKGKKIVWTVIQGVWVEMLCFSAGRSRGYLHAKSLGNGGEYLSRVWLLLWYTGMETFSARLQRRQDGDMGAAVETKTPVKKKPSVKTKPPVKKDSKPTGHEAV